ncbi:MAG: glucan biosynthesis protein [Verrucomicrobia bacterium]|nr:MAG: glucan biosynthesis protein [Verrucomicrobiota bacterium]
MSETTPADTRRHDLDALRASAMLLGIIYHAALSFAAGFGWMVQDVSQSQGIYLFQFWSHGFRMQLFFMISGFFTAMLWRKRGLRALIWHRFRRIFIPCMLGLITVVPAMTWATGYAYRAGQERRAAEVARQQEPGNVWEAVRSGDLGALEARLAEGLDLDTRHPQHGFTPLTWAALVGREDVARWLLDHGADVNARNRDGRTALHAAAFLGRTNIVELLLARGIDPQIRAYEGDTARNSAHAPWQITAWIAGSLQLPLDRQAVEAGRRVVEERLAGLGVPLVTPGQSQARNGGRPAGKLQALWFRLLYTPVFILIWFLWFLCWFVACFALYARLAERFGWKQPLRRWVLSPWNLLWLTPLTLIPQWFMGESNGGFGPDISMGIIPIPHIFFYYILFFGFGVLYFDARDDEGRLGRGWKWMLPVATFLVFPVALECATGRLGFREAILPPAAWRPVSMVLQALYAWMMTFGSLGLFRRLLRRENKTIRYISDSSYWLYLSHLPLVIVLQAWVQEWPLPAWLKLAMVSAVTVGVLLFVYDKCVRYTWIGTLLNGKRTRPGKTRPLPAVPEGTAG